MFPLLLVVGAPTGQALTHQEDQEQAEQHDRQAVLP
jgi:hypothetical protein